MKRLLLAVCLTALLSSAAQKPFTRDWKIYIITHTHADIGYTDLIPEVERVWCQGMDMAIDASSKGLKWTLEGSLLFDTYTRHRKPERVQQLVDLVKQGKIEIASLYTNIEQENAGPEELIRANYYAKRRSAAAVRHRVQDGHAQRYHRPHLGPASRALGHRHALTCCSAPAHIRNCSVIQAAALVLLQIAGRQQKC